MKNEFKHFDILQYSREVANTLDKKGEDIDYTNMDRFPLQKSQCMYVIDWSVPAISYRRGIKDLLGYNDDEFDLEKALSYIHPEDVGFCNRITRGTVNHVIKIKNNPKNYLNLTYRIKRKCGSYIKVLRQSGMYLDNGKGKMLANYSLLTDISFMETGNAVTWEIEANDLDKEAFHRSIYTEFANIFTKREKEIIQLMHEGAKTEDIACTLHRSPHTVHTHRKNIYRKANCGSKKSLFDFCLKNGIL